MISFSVILFTLSIAVLIRFAAQLYTQTHIMRRGPRFVNLQNNGPRNLQTAPSTSDDYASGPSPSDVRLVRAYLKHLSLPTELVLSILDEADYRPLLIAHRNEKVALYSHVSRSGNEGAALYLTSPVIPVGLKRAGITHVPKKITYRISSHDQGYCSEPGLAGTYNGHTWFEATILRPRSDTDTGPGSVGINYQPLERQFPRQPLPSWKNPGDAAESIQSYGWDFILDEDGNAISWRVQNNLSATRSDVEHEITWEKGQEVEIIDPSTNDFNGRGNGQGFFDILREGDRIALWARALYPGWINHIKEASIEITYDEHQ
ncbi:hypothetical protein EJ05DRAFT_282582 [Pseudovirgaria hyperparasitica]|uniref:F-box domain-containing protein n=1 Tax=Pseudovirgaria hyperparasitica TaxID=470096 RepID=A0A6A6WDW3_9PEZI|nr:uncharacterized protein EJ05DRAFT_282582 [Pseudovirgaria hyperparasitica]KAF2760369.1 hypothetical protein EJ05DRAFT_282582 [Pseudovirgaria hyperparasitica]